MKLKYTLFLTFLLLFYHIKVFANDNIFTPINISITFGEDSLTEKNITWNTLNNTESKSIIELWENELEKNFFEGKSEIIKGKFDYFPNKSDLNKTSNEILFNTHKIYLKNLKPDTKYYFKCGDGENWSEVKSFKTGISKGVFSFIYMTDSQAFSNSDFKILNKTFTKALEKSKDPSFFTISGDLIDRGVSENLWNKFFSNGDILLSNYTIVPAVGNHETDYGTNSFNNHFSFSEKKDYNLPDYVHSFDYGNAHFSILSTEMTYGQIYSKNLEIKKIADDLFDNQIKWLREDVAKHNKKWNFVVLHKGLYTSGPYSTAGDTFYYQEKFGKLFDELSIDAVLQGHNHVFDKAFIYDGKKVGLLNEDSNYVDKTKYNGTFYLTANSAGPKFYEPKKNIDLSYLLKYAGIKKQMYTEIIVNENYLTFKTYIIDGLEDTLFDSFVIEK